MQNSKLSKTELFERVSIPRALAAMGIPTIISQLINLIYNMVDAFFIGRTGNSYMMAATTITLTLTMLNVAFANLYGVGGGSLIARLMGQKRDEVCPILSQDAFHLFKSLHLILDFLDGYQVETAEDFSDVHITLLLPVVSELTNVPSCQKKDQMPVGGSVGRV